LGDHLHIGFRLNEFIARPVNGEIEGADGVQHVSPRSMEVLLALARKPGWVLSHRQLREQVWGSAKVANTVVSRAVGELRHVLGDKPDSPRFIQTIPGRGYRLIPDPLPLSSPAPDIPRLKEESGRPPVHEPGQHEEPAGFLGHLASDLARRKVYRVAASYAVGSWVLLQVADVLLEAFPLPAFTMTFLVVALAMGFPVAVAMAWALEWTPRGLMVESASGELTPASSAARVGKMVYLVAGVSAILVGTGAYWLTATDAPHAMPDPAKESIAVLPFRNFSDSAANEYFSDGLTEEVLNVLAQLGNLQVASRTSSFYFKDKDLDITDAAKALNVHYVLEGSVRLAGENMRITAQLIDGQNGFHLWSGTYDRKVQDVFAVQSDIAKQVARNLNLVLNSNVEDELEIRPTENFEAYDAYLRGRDYLNKARSNENLSAALHQFEQAVALDASFGLAYAGICETRLAQYERNAETGLFEQAEKACHRAMTRDAKAAEVSLALGKLHLLAGQNELAMEEIEQALKLRPRWVEARLARAQALVAEGLQDEAETQYKEAIELDPGNWQSYSYLGTYYFNRGLYRDAVAQFQEVVTRTPDNANAYNNLAGAYYLQGNLQSAAEIWLKSVQIMPTAGMYYNIGTMYFYLRQFEDAVAMYRRAIGMSPDEYLFWGGIGEACRQMPNRWSEAETAYNKAIELANAMLEINPENTEVLENVSVFYAGLGDFTKAFQLLELVASKNAEDPYHFYNTALVQIRAGLPEMAEEALMRAVELGYPVNQLSMDAGLDPLRGRLRFEALASANNNLQTES
jgi:TolB-like protein/Flp pilus assembly protein TadD/DNA-binding winged helix-turn-helix (wHTH) protein